MQSFHRERERARDVVSSLQCSVCRLLQEGDRKRGRSHPSDDILYAIDDDDPLLSQDNVILLRTHNEPLNITRILFNVVKSQTIAKGAYIDEEAILDPVKVSIYTLPYLCISISSG